MNKEYGEAWDETEAFAEHVGRLSEGTLKTMIANARKRQAKLRTMLAAWTSGARWLRKSRRAGAVVPVQAAQRLIDDTMAEMLSEVRAVRELRGQMMEQHGINEEQSEAALKVIITEMSNMAEQRLLPALERELQEWKNGQTKH